MASKQQRPTARNKYCDSHLLTLFLYYPTIDHYERESIIANHLYAYDLPDGLVPEGDLAVDTEAMGLNNLRDRLCVVQLSDGNGDAYLVHFPQANYDAPNLKKLLSDTNRQYLFHFARFDVAIMMQYLGITFSNIYCTRTASYLCRTYTDRHGLKDLCKELLGVELSKQQQSSYWGAAELTTEQTDYAASDVLYLHRLRDELEERLQALSRQELAQRVMRCIPVRSELDLSGWAEKDIFAHS